MMPSESLAVMLDGKSQVAYPRLNRMRTPWTRAVGLIGRKSIDESTAYLFMWCPSVHTCFMAIPIDVIVLDKRMRVLAVDTMRPWNPTSPKVAGARHIIEAAAGSAASNGIKPGADLMPIVREYRERAGHAYQLSRRPGARKRSRVLPEPRRARRLQQLAGEDDYRAYIAERLEGCSVRLEAPGEIEQTITFATCSYFFAPMNERTLVYASDFESALSKKGI